jgi:hypothetical protein
MFNERQLLGLELSCRRIEAVKDEVEHYREICQGEGVLRRSLRVQA